MTTTVAVRQVPNNERQIEMWTARASVDGAAPSGLICYGRYRE
jgi:hypothetical protein